MELSNEEYNEIRNASEHNAGPYGEMNEYGQYEDY